MAKEQRIGVTPIRTQAINGNFQYDPEVKGIFLNVRLSAARAIQRFLILGPTKSPRSSGKSPFPGCWAMAVLPQK